ncbi:MAG: VacJ family lipoprotein [bacterium]
MRKIFSILIATVLGIATSGAAAPDREIVIITKDGLKASPGKREKNPKNSHDTLFLRSVVEPSAQKAPAKPAKPVNPAPKVKPTPAPPVQKPLKTKNTAIAKEHAITIQKKKTASRAEDDLDEYSHIATIADPAESVNRGTFWLNHQLYHYLLRPVSKAYEFILPSPARTAIHNVFDNAEYPVRLVNHALQFQFKRADLETRKFLVNSVAGVGGIFRVSDRIPELAAVPSADTGQTFAKWGIGHGAYVVLPVLGPRSVRDTVGMAGDYALNPLTWLTYGGLGGAATLAISGPNAAQSINNRMNLYDAATRNVIDPYVAVRSGYIQYREQAASK